MTDIQDREYLLRSSVAQPRGQALLQRGGDGRPVHSRSGSAQNLEE